MGSNNGTGHPLWFCCSKCRAERPGRLEDRTSEIMGRGSISRVELTGRSREVPSGGGARMCSFAWQYRCLDCGHIGWSRHVDVGRKAGYKKPRYG